VVEQLELLLHWAGLRAASVSIDDFYLTFQVLTKALCCGRESEEGADKPSVVGGNQKKRDESRGLGSILRFSFLSQIFHLLRHFRPDCLIWSQDQRALAEKHPENPLLQYRGNAGTHDLALGAETVNALRHLTQAGSSMKVRGEGGMSVSFSCPCNIRLYTNLVM
jgi:hypothetical protein